MPRLFALCGPAPLLATALTLAGCKSEPSADSRLARLEQRVDKIVALLDKALPAPEADPTAIYSVPIAANDPTEGPADARITLVEGFEFACPYCFLAQPLLAQLRTRYPDDLRIVSKYYLIHGQPAVPAGLAACAAHKQGQFTTMKRAMWKKIFTIDPGSGDPQLAANELAATALLSTAGEAGLDLGQLRADMESEDCRSWVQRGEADLQAVGAKGTPAFYLNGRALSDFDLTSIEAMIQAELRKADAVLATGVRAADYYRIAVVERGLPRVKRHFED